MILKGYIKVSLQMLGPGDEIVIHDVKSEQKVRQVILIFCRAPGKRILLHLR